MKTKTCSKCKIEYEANLINFKSQKNGKYGLRSQCKKCIAEYNKQQRSKPENKERHRIANAKWRSENLEKSRLIDKKCREKFAEKISSKRKEKYRNDPEYKKKVIEREKIYKESGRRYEINNKPEQRYRAIVRSRIRRSDELKKQHDYKTQSLWREKNRDYIREKDRMKIENVHKHHIASCMKVSSKILTDDIIELKRNIILLKRQLKNNNVKIR